MRPADVNRAAFLLRSIEKIEEWIETLEEQKETIVEMELSVCDDEQSGSRGFGDADTYINKKIMIEGLSSMKDCCLADLEHLGVKRE